MSSEPCPSRMAVAFAALLGVLGFSVVDAQESGQSSRGAVESEGLPRAEPADVGMSAEQLQRTAAAIEALIDADRVAGTVTMVARKGKVVFEHVAGHRVL